jgi:hypothetical protein
MTRRYPRITRGNTIAQRLLMEIRDELEALPLAAELKRSDIDQARALRVELDELAARLERVEHVQRLLARATGIDPEELTEDELGLLTEAGAV